MGNYNTVKKKAVCMLIEDDYSIIYKSGYIWKKHINGYEQQISKLVVNTRVPRFLQKIRLIQRVLRIQPRGFCYIKDRYLFFGIKRTIYALDFTDYNLKVIKTLNSNMSAPLHIEDVNDIQGFKDEVIFGEYYKNNQKNEVKVHCYNYVDDSWKVLYTYKEGTINHIHGIFRDSYRNRLWILTGDCNKCSNIWFTDNMFSDMDIFLGGKQMYRACQFFPFKDSIMYATDSPDEKNHIFSYDLNANCKSIHQINGSVIYGSRYKNGFVFATVVEPKQQNSLIKNLLSYKLGTGILNRQSEIVYYNGENTHVMLSVKKDLLPMGLFQFGTFSFPAGLDKSKHVYANGISLWKIDNKVIVLSEVEKHE